MKTTIIAATILAASSAMANPYGDPFAFVYGHVCRIHDADTFRVCHPDGSQTKIRLRGVDAPEVTRKRGVTATEIEQGKAARDWLIENHDGSLVTCGLLGVNRGRIVADCWIGQSLGAAVVETGLVRACEAFGGGYENKPEAESLPAKPYCEAAK